MRLYDQYRGYLDGNSFSTSLEVQIAQPVKIIDDRMNILVQESIGKKVIDLGCVDHLEQLEHKINQNLWLHARLAKVANQCLGIDINRQGIDLLRQNLNCNDVIYGDIQNDEIPEIQADHWDLIIAGEILEHTDNPVLFLENIRQKYARNIARMIVTVPNAFSLFNHRQCLAGREIINSDHRYWFTPYTLAKVLLRAGFELEKYQFCERYFTPADGPLAKVRHQFSLRNFLLRQYPSLMNTIVFWASL